MPRRAPACTGQLASHVRSPVCTDRTTLRAHCEQVGIGMRYAASLHQLRQAVRRIQATSRVLKRFRKDFVLWYSLCCRCKLTLGDCQARFRGFSTAITVPSGNVTARSPSRRAANVHGTRAHPSASGSQTRETESTEPPLGCWATISPAYTPPHTVARRSEARNDPDGKRSVETYSHRPSRKTSRYHSGPLPLQFRSFFAPTIVHPVPVGSGCVRPVAMSVARVTRESVCVICIWFPAPSLAPAFDAPADAPGCWGQRLKNLSTSESASCAS